MIRTLLLVVLLLSLAGVTAAAQEIDSALRYRPMAIGNQWEYRRVHVVPWSDTTYPSITIIGDILMPNGHRYFMFDQRGDMYSTDPARRYFQRLDSTSGVIYQYADPDTEYVIDNLRCWDGNRALKCGYRQYGYPLPIREMNADYYLYGLGLWLLAREQNPDPNPLWEDYWITTLIHARIDGREFQIDGGNITELAVDESAMQPTGLALEGNVPEPFTDGTTITFSLRSRSDITLTILDILGNRITTLADGTCDAGRHQLRLNGAGLAAGSYLCVLRSGGREVTRMVHLRR
ncbi:MAG: hypothetical protein ABIR47_01315 [Candidatus Kapaibacterium sp.]